MSASPWSSSSMDPSSIWTSNPSSNLNLLRRYSLRTTTTSNSASASPSSVVASLHQHGQHHHQALLNSQQPNSNTSNQAAAANNNPAAANKQSTCTWEPSVDNKYLIAYIVISRQDMELYNESLGFQLGGGKPTRDGQYGAIVEHVTPGSLMNIVCKLKVGDEVVEWNGFSLRNKRNDEVADIIESTKSCRAFRLVAIRAVSESAGAGSS